MLDGKRLKAITTVLWKVGCEYLSDASLGNSPEGLGTRNPVEREDRRDVCVRGPHRGVVQFFN